MCSQTWLGFLYADRVNLKKIKSFWKRALQRTASMSSKVSVIHSVNSLDDACNSGKFSYRFIYLYMCGNLSLPLLHLMCGTGCSLTFLLIGSHWQKKKSQIGLFKKQILVHTNKKRMSLCYCDFLHIFMLSYLICHLRCIEFNKIINLLR